MEIARQGPGAVGGSSEKAFKQENGEYFLPPTTESIGGGTVPSHTASKTDEPTKDDAKSSYETVIVEPRTFEGLSNDPPLESTSPALTEQEICLEEVNAQNVPHHAERTQQMYGTKQQEDIYEMLNASAQEASVTDLPLFDESTAPAAIAEGCPEAGMEVEASIITTSNTAEVIVQATEAAALETDIDVEGDANFESQGATAWERDYTEPSGLEKLVEEQLHVGELTELREKDHAESFGLGKLIKEQSLVDEQTDLEEKDHSEHSGLERLVEEQSLIDELSEPHETDHTESFGPGKVNEEQSLVGEFTESNVKVHTESLGLGKLNEEQLLGDESTEPHTKVHTESLGPGKLDEEQWLVGELTEPHKKDHMESLGLGKLNEEESLAGGHTVPQEKDDSESSGLKKLAEEQSVVGEYTEPQENDHTESLGLRKLVEEQLLVHERTDLSHQLGPGGIAESQIQVANLLAAVPSTLQEGQKRLLTEEKIPVAAMHEASEEDIKAIKGQKVRKRFGRQNYFGDVVDYDPETKWFKVIYEDGDEEDLEVWEVKPILASAVAQPSSSKKRARSKGTSDEAKMSQKKAKKAPKKSMPKKKRGSDKKTSGESSKLPKSKSKSEGKSPKKVSAAKKDASSEKAVTKSRKTTPSKSIGNTRSKGGMATSKRRKSMPKSEVISKASLVQSPGSSTRKAAKVPIRRGKGVGVKSRGQKAVQKLKADNDKKQRTERKVPTKTGEVMEKTLQTEKSGPAPYIGRSVRKDFGGSLFEGSVVKFDNKTNLYKVKYEDGDQEDLELAELKAILVSGASSGISGIKSSKATQSKSKGNMKSEGERRSSTRHKSVTNSEGTSEAFPVYLQSSGPSTGKAVKLPIRGGKGAGISTGLKAVGKRKADSDRKLGMKRPRKSNDKLKKSSNTEKTVPASHIGRSVRKNFGGTSFEGTVVRFNNRTNFYKVKYEDGDEEDLELAELEAVLVPGQSDIDTDTTPTKLSSLSSLMSPKNVKKRRNITA